VNKYLQIVNRSDLRFNISSTIADSWAAIVLVLFMMSVQLLVQHFLPRWLPHSFTAGEAALVSQGTSIFVILAGKQYIAAATELVRMK